VTRSQADEGTTVFERFTEQARAVVLAARDAATEVERADITSYDLVCGSLTVEGSVAARALTELGVTAATLQAQAPTSAPIAGAPAATETGATPVRRPFRAELKQALEAVAAEAETRGHTAITTGHLLLGIIATPDSAGAQALGAAGFDAETVRAAIDRAHDGPTGGETATTTGAIIGALASFGDRLSAMPGRFSPALESLLALAWYAVTAAILIGFVWENPHLPTVFALLGGIPAALLGMYGAQARSSSERPSDRQFGEPLYDPPQQVLAAVRRVGITTLTIHRARPGVPGDRCYRVGRRGMVVLNPSSAWDVDRLPFVLGHEVAHLVRRDHLRRRLAGALYAGACTTAFLSADRTAMAVAAASVLVHVVATRWASELSCDAWAVRWSSVEAMRSWAAYRRTTRRRSINRWVDPRLTGLGSLLTHPPLALRLARTARS
jgi:hypothetical protein